MSRYLIPFRSYYNSLDISNKIQISEVNYFSSDIYVTWKLIASGAAWWWKTENVESTVFGQG